MPGLRRTQREVQNHRALVGFRKREMNYRKKRLIKKRYIFDKKFKPHWKNYVFQTIGATIVITLVLLLFHMNRLVIVASIGASAFIVFAMPRYPTAKARNLIGGHSIALIVGALCNLIPEVVFLLTVIVDAFAVGVALFLMAITETEHPPAASTALGVAVSGISFDMVIAVLLSTILLSLIHMLFKKQLKNLV
jgi:CBS-domain-containing membrane protein